MKHVGRRSTPAQVNSSNPEPGELFSGQFVVFTVYALLELPAAVSWSFIACKLGLNPIFNRTLIALIRHTAR